MLAVTNNFKTAIQASKRQLAAKVELYTGSTLTATYMHTDAIKSITIDRTGEESKFFGFSVTHRFNIKLRDVTRTINVSTANHFKISLGLNVNGTYEYVSYPLAYVTEVNRDENTNELSITAYDLLNSAKTLLQSDLGLVAPYSIKNVAEACSGLLKASSVVIPELDIFNLEYPTGANFEGSETLQEVIKAIAEATQTICYVNASNQLVFKRLDKDGAAVKTITKEHYFDLDSGTNKRLQTIACITELGDNVHASTTQNGSTQYIRNNGFLDLREDITSLVEAAVAAVGNITINQFSCKWRGDMAVEVGDKINIVTKNNESVTTYLLSDSITYNGALEESSEWKYTDEEKVDSSPSTLGDIIKETYAKVDKVNKEISLFITESEVNTKVETAKNEAINAATSDAEQMATDAQNNATAAAKTYTDGQIKTVNNTINTKTAEIKLTTDAITQQVSTLEEEIQTIGTSQGYTKEEVYTKTETDAQIKTASDAITLSVSKTYETKTNVQSQVSTAKTEAINAAASDATTKANNAKSAAISTAASDATTKATTAESNANGYTDGKIEEVNEDLGVIEEDIRETNTQISMLETRADGIEANVSNLKETQTITTDALGNINEELTSLTNSVNTKMTAEDVNIAIKSELNNGVSKVSTETGFTFDENGLHIAKTGSEMETTVDEDGISVYKDGDEVLTADHEGVIAYDLHAKTYLIIGESSRFEDYEKDGEQRTGCFWIGGNN